MTRSPSRNTKCGSACAPQAPTKLTKKTRAALESFVDFPQLSRSEDTVREPSFGPLCANRHRQSFNGTQFIPMQFGLCRRTLLLLQVFFQRFHRRLCRRLVRRRKMFERELETFPKAEMDVISFPD